MLIAANGLLLLTDHQLYSNHRWLLIVLCAWFAFARSDRAWALGARRRRERSDGLVPWWPQLLLIATISSVYLYSGLCKINAEFLSGAMLVEMTPRWVPATLLAWTTPPAEIAIGVGIWFRRTRWMALTTGVILHLGIVVLLGAPLVFGAFALLCFAGYPSVATAPVGAILQAAPAATQRSSAA